MKTIYHPGRSLAIASGIAATTGAIGLLISDAIGSGHWTQEHALVPLVVGLTVATGHLAATALKRGKVLAAAGFAVAFAVGTGITILNGMGRQSEGVEAKMAEAAAHNEAIVAKHDELAKARERFRQANIMVDREMTGQRCLKRCEDWKLRAKEVAAHMSALETELASLGAVKPVNAKAAKVGEIATAFGLDGKKAAAVVLLIEPTLLPFLLEWTAIFAFGYGFSGVRREPPAPTFKDEDLAPIPEDRDPVVDWVREFRARHGRNPMIPEVQKRFPGTPKTTAWRRATAA